jgi:hypothetical protein
MREGFEYASADDAAKAFNTTARTVLASERWRQDV